MPSVTIEQLFARIGRLTMENEALREENSQLRRDAEVDITAETEVKAQGDKEWQQP